MWAAQHREGSVDVSQLTITQSVCIYSWLVIQPDLTPAGNLHIRAGQIEPVNSRWSGTGEGGEDAGGGRQQQQCRSSSQAT